MEAFLPFRYRPADDPMVSEVRSTIIVSGIQTLRAHGLFDRYAAFLAPDPRNRLLSLIAGEWIPVDLAVEHYRAADRLALSPMLIEQIGGEVAARINKSVLSIAVTVSKQAGVTPWSALSLAHRINDINWRGGDIAVAKMGPKDALYDWIGQPCAAIPYFVRSFGGFLSALAGLFCAKAFARALPERCSTTKLAYRLSWA